MGITPKFPKYSYFLKNRGVLCPQGVVVGIVFVIVVGMLMYTGVGVVGGMGNFMGMSVWQLSVVVFRVCVCV